VKPPWPYWDNEGSQQRVPVSRLDRRVTLVAGLVLIASLALCWQSRRELDKVRGELQTVTAANEFLKRTLGDMTIAITGKDKEIDRLEHAPCNGHEKETRF
jgi:hypothetical protein